MLSWLLLMRITIFNACGLAAAFYAYKLGYATQVFKSDASYIPYGILALFLIGLASTFIRGFKVSKAINEHKSNTYRGFFKERRVEKLEAKQAHIFDIGEWLYAASVFGTAVGVWMAVADPSASNEQLRVSLFNGLHVALPATIMGISLAIWTGVNFRMLDTAVQSLKQDVRQ